MRLSVSPLASRQIRSIYAYVAHDNLQAATKVVARIGEVAKFVAANPGAGRATLVPDVRAFPANPYPYVIYFRKLRDEVRIVRVLHAAQRRPGLREEGPVYLAELAQAR